jgi:putative ABC transport system permease protein
MTAFDALRQELRHGARRLVRAPLFSAAAVLTLALAIGANASIFAVVKRVVLDPLPYPDSDRLIEVDHGALGLNLPSGMGSTSGLYFHYAARSRTLERFALYRFGGQTLTGDGDPERVVSCRTTPSLAPVLRVWPALGRWFTDEEGRPGAARVAIISHGLWVRRYGRDPRILERHVTLGGEPTQIVGVMPASYAFPDPRVDLWVPEPLARETGFGLWGNSGVARLRDGVSFEAARAELTSLIADIPAAFPGDPFALGNVQTKVVFAGRPLKDATIGSVAQSLWILLASVGVVLLVACANVANLFLARSEARQREIAVRRALGADRLATARYFLCESVLLSAAGGALGLLLAYGAVRLLVAAGPVNLPRLQEIQLDSMSIAFTIVLSLVAALVFGAMPLWRASQLAAAAVVQRRGATASRARHRARHLLMGAQVALALVLVVASGLMMRSFQKLRALDPGFDASSALTFTISLPERAYRSRDAVVAGHHAIIDRMSTVPGVTAVAAASCLPLTGGCFGNTVRFEGRVQPEGTLPPAALWRAVSGGYFEAMGTRLLRGRSIDRGDVARKEPIAVIDEALAKRYFPDRDPLGQRIASNRPPPAPGQPRFIWLTIVGVVANTPSRTLTETNAPPVVYMPMSIARGPEHPISALIGPDVSYMTYVVRSAIPPAELQTPVRREIAALDNTLAVAQARSLQEILDGASAQMAFTMTLIAIAAAVALLLGVVGIYGVMSYIVTQRTAEIGVRLALGAEPGRVAALIVRQGGTSALVGVVAGLATAFAGSRAIASLLYGISPHDPVVFGATTLVLIGVALTACWIPARRASRMSPLAALRAE